MLMNDPRLDITRGARVTKTRKKTGKLGGVENGFAVTGGGGKVNTRRK